MSEPAAACPQGHSGEGYRVVKNGYAHTATGRKRVYLCIAVDGTAHQFRRELDPADAAPAPTREVRCPRPGHKDAVIHSRGTRTSSTGVWRRYQCLRPNGDTHLFRLMLSEDDSVTAPASSAPPPPCPEHPGSKVTRAGTYGKRSRRQRYLCKPVDGTQHQFTPPLSREVVAPGQACKKCDELLSPHHGPVTAARHTTWPLAAVTQALNDLSLGSSYADVGLAMRAHRDAARDHLEHDHGIAAFTRAASPATTTTSSSRKERRSAWRNAADLVEQYSPALFADVDDRYRAQAQALREHNDAALAADPSASLAQPLVYILDELPIWTKAVPGKPKRPEWYVLAVVEVGWRTGSDPFALPERDTRLRLARAFPRANTDAWRLVLNELQVRPDFVVADKGSGIQGALAAHYGTSVGVVPSLWHIHTNLRDGLLRLQNATYLDGKELVLVDPLRKHLSALARNELLGRTPDDITAWWDELERIVTRLPAPVSGVIAQRDLHEPRLIAALPILNANPHVPASNAAVENRIRMALKPFLVNRAHLFGNQERTNRLLNLLVARQAGVFANLDDLALSLRAMNETAGGWAPAPGQILDKQPPASTSRTRRYSSLKAHSVIGKLAKGQGLPTTAQLAASAPMPLTSKQKPETVARLPIRQWARNLGLPGNPTGPIRATVQAAYDAAQNGATDAEAVELYHQLEQERLTANSKAKQAKWAGGAGTARQAELAPIRQWAAANGIAVAKNARIPQEVLDAYAAAQAGTTRKRRPSKLNKTPKPPKDAP